MVLGAEGIDKRYTSIAWITDFTKTSLLGKFRGLRTQLDNLPLILSMRSYHEAFFMVPLPKGTPRYLEGKDPLVKPKILTIFLGVMSAVFRKNT